MESLHESWTVYEGCSNSNRTRGNLLRLHLRKWSWMYCTTGWYHQIRKLSFFYYNLFWNKQLSKTTICITLPYFGVWKIEVSRRDLRVMISYDYMNDSHLQENSLENLRPFFSARMLRREPKSLSGLMDLDEAGGVSMIRAPVLRHTSDCF